MTCVVIFGGAAWFGNATGRHSLSTMWYVGRGETLYTVGAPSCSLLRVCPQAFLDAAKALAKDLNILLGVTYSIEDSTLGDSYTDRNMFALLTPQGQEGFRCQKPAPHLN